MKYRIEYATKRPGYVNSRTELLALIKHPQDTVTDIRKVHKSGVTDSVIDKYRYLMGEMSEQEIYEAWKIRVVPIIAELVVEARKMSKEDYSTWKIRVLEHTDPKIKCFMERLYVIIEEYL